MKTVKDIASITMTGKRWFQRTYGNTYHSVTVVIIYSDKEIESLFHGQTYGYGSQYNQTAKEIFCKRFNYESDLPYLTSICRELKIPCIESVEDVSREKDLRQTALY